MQANWYPVEAYKPDDDIIVMIHDPDMSEPVWLGYYEHEEDRWWTSEGGICNPTHWMELPEVPEVEHA